MQKHRRLLRSRDFASVRDECKSWSNPNFVMLVSERVDRYTGGPSRFGFIVSKKIGNAVTRNRYKRQMRHSTNVFNVKSGYDVIFIARKRIQECDFQDIYESMRKLFSLSKLYKKLD